MGRLKKKISRELRKAVRDLKKQLPDNGIKLVSDRTGKKMPQVSDIFNLLRYPDEVVLNAAIDVIKETKAKEKTIVDAVNELNC